MLESLLKDTASKIFQAGGIDSPVVTKRRSRMCVGVKASQKNLVPGGIILSSSGSGATYFMEPREAVELNNREVKLSGDERAEELVILGLLTSSIADSQLKIRNLMDKILSWTLHVLEGRMHYGQMVSNQASVTVIAAASRIRAATIQFILRAFGILCYLNSLLWQKIQI